MRTPRPRPTVSNSTAAAKSPTLRVSTLRRTRWLNYLLRVSVFTFRTEDNRIKFPLHLDEFNYNGKLVTHEGQRYEVLRAADTESVGSADLADLTGLADIAASRGSLEPTYIVEKVDQ
jgi:hypothetical protein